MGADKNLGKLRPRSRGREGGAWALVGRFIASSASSCGGLELGAVPIIIAVCARSWHGRPVAGFVVRKEIKDHGTEQKIDGNFKPDSTVILFDDVTTKGGSVMRAVRAVRGRGARVAKIITLVDRLEGASENLGKEGIELVALYTTRELLS